MMRRYIGITLILVIILNFTGCKNQDRDTINIAGKIYTYEKEGIGGEFKIYINDDGTFTYYEGMLSSYFGVGTWEIENSVITLTDDDEMGYALVNRFMIEGDTLLFIEEGSDNFLYVKVKDGETFFGEPFQSKDHQISEPNLENSYK